MPLLLLQTLFIIVVLSGNGCLGMGIVGTYPIPTIPNVTIQCIAKQTATTTTTEYSSYPSIITAVIYSSGDIVTFTEGDSDFKMFPGRISFEGSAEWTEGLKTCAIHRDALYFASWKKCGKIPLKYGLILSSYCGSDFSDMLVTDSLTFLWSSVYNTTNFLFSTNFLDGQPTFIGNLSFSPSGASFSNQSYFSLFGFSVVNVYHVSGSSVTLLTSRQQTFIAGGAALFYPFLYFIVRVGNCFSILQCELMGGCYQFNLNYLCVSGVTSVDFRVSNSKLYLYIPNNGGVVTQFNLPVPTQQTSLLYSNIKDFLSSPIALSGFGNSVFFGISFNNNISLQLYFLANCENNSYYDYISNTCISCTRNSEPISVYIANSNCSTCPPGQYIAANKLDCSPCPPGSYGTTEHTCETCMSGTFNPYYERTYCEKCPPGTFSHSLVNTVSCTPCPKAFYSLEGSSTCFPCPAGSFGNVTGGQCFKCPYGYYSHDMAESCQECPPGYVLTSVSDCKPCGKGKSTTGNETDKRDDYSTCFYCTDNSFNNDIGQAKCTPCPKGTFSNEQYTQCISCWKDMWGKNKYCPAAAQIIIGVSSGVFIIIISIIIGVFWRRKNWGEKIKQKWKYRNQKSFGDIKMDKLDSGGKHIRLKNDFPDDTIE